MTMIKRLSPREIARSLPTIKVERLSRNEFSSALKRGQGRALLHVAEYGDKGIEKELKRCLLKDANFNSERYRVTWILSLVELSGRPKFYGKYLMDNFCRSPISPSDMEHQFRLAHDFFENGMLGFRAMMFERFERIVLTDYLSECGDALLEVAGQAGLEYIAKLCGTYAEHVSRSNCSSILDSAIKLGCETTIMERMTSVSEHVPEVKAFMEICEVYKQESKRKCRSKNSRIKIEDLDALIKEGIEDKVSFKFLFFGISASEAELSRVTEKLLGATSNKERAAWLRVFCFNGVPEKSTELLKFLNSRNFAVQRSAALAFAQTESAEVREIAYRLLHDGRKSQFLNALSLLESNYKAVDSERINRGVQSLVREEDIHRANLSIQDIVDCDDSAALAPSVLYLLENVSCSCCRFELLKKLVEWDKCPFRYLWEAQWDVDLDTQNYARSVVANLEL